MKEKKILVVGATGCVGREFLSILAERGSDPKNVVAVASEKSKGSILKFGNSNIKVYSISDINFSDFDLAFFSAGSNVSKEYAPVAASSGCIVIDNSSFFRTIDDVPLIVPEVNFEDIKNYKNKNLISNPNCSTIQMVMILKPLHDLFQIREIVVSTYQSVSGAGQKGIAELEKQTKFCREPAKHFPKTIAFNIIPQIDEFTNSLYTKEEIKMINETKKILKLHDIDITATCVRVPVIRGHSESIFIKFQNHVDLEEAKHLLSKRRGIKIVEEKKYITPIEASNKDDVFVSRIREHTTIKNAISCFVVSDNLRKGAALNAIQISERF